MYLNFLITIKIAAATLLTSAAITFIPFAANAAPRGPEFNDVVRFNKILDYVQSSAPELDNICAGRCIRFATVKDKTVVLVVADQLGYADQDTTYGALKNFAELWNRTIRWKYETGLSMRTESGVWLGGIGTRDLRYYAPGGTSNAAL